MFEFAFLNWRRGGKAEPKATPTPSPAVAADVEPVKTARTPSRHDHPRGNYAALTTPTPGLGSKRSDLLTVRTDPVFSRSPSADRLRDG